MDMKRIYVAPDSELEVNIDAAVGVVQMSNGTGKGDSGETNPTDPEVEPEW